MTQNKQSLFSDDSSDSEVNFGINEKYAQGHDKWRRSEELQKLKAKYGDSSLSSSSSESEEDNVPLIEQSFLKTLSLLKSNDPKIYDESVKFFDESEKPEIKPKTKKTKPLYIKDYERKQLLEKNGDEKVHLDISSVDDQDIRESFKTEVAESENDEEDNVFHTRQKDYVKKGKEEAGCILWLKGEKAELSDEDADGDLNYLHDYWTDPNLEGNEQYLKDYILNKRYAENEDSDVIPSYEEVTNSVENLSDDEEILEKQAVFEQKYNFRFEEPDSEFIKQYPRTIGDSLRRTDKKRTFKRNDYQERKQQEKEQKQEEIKRLKAFKRAEIEEMLNKLKETTGSDNFNFNCGDIGGDFDPDEHDKRMKELFNEEYYGVEEIEKPEFPCDEEFDSENWDNWTGDFPNCDGEKGLHCEDPDFNMDAEYNPKLEFQRKMIESQTKKSKKKKRKSKFAEAVATAKPIFDASSKKLEDYIDEYYNLDCEDVIGDEVFRFKYRNVVANDFGLSANEILVARDKELNKWCSLKKTCQYRNDEEENYDIVAFKKKIENVNSKKKILPSLFQENEVKNSDALPESTSKKSQKRKRKMKKVDEGESLGNADYSNKVVNEQPVAKQCKTKDNDEQAVTMSCDDDVKEKQKNHLSVSNDHAQNSDIAKKKKRKKKKKPAGVIETVDCKKLSMPSPVVAGKRQQMQNKHNQNANVADKRLQLSDARLKAYGINPKKFKNRIKYSKKD